MRMRESPLCPPVTPSVTPPPPPPLLHASYLLQEGREVAGAPPVGPRQVDVLQVEDQLLGGAGPEGAAGAGAQQLAGLGQLLQHVAGRGPGAAVHHGHLGGAQPREGVAQEHPDGERERSRRGQAAHPHPSLILMERERGHREDRERILIPLSS